MFHAHRPVRVVDDHRLLHLQRADRLQLALPEGLQHVLAHALVVAEVRLAQGRLARGGWSDEQYQLGETVLGTHESPDVLLRPVPKRRRIEGGSHVGVGRGWEERGACEQTLWRVEGKSAVLGVADVGKLLRLLP